MVVSVTATLTKGSLHPTNSDRKRLDGVAQVLGALHLKAMVGFGGSCYVGEGLIVCRHKRWATHAFRVLVLRITRHAGGEFPPLAWFVGKPLIGMERI